MKTNAFGRIKKRFTSLLPVLSVMVGLLVPFDLKAFAEDPAPAPTPSDPVPYYVAGTMTDRGADDVYQMERSKSADAVEY